MRSIVFNDDKLEEVKEKGLVCKCQAMHNTYSTDSSNFQQSEPSVSSIQRFTVYLIEKPPHYGQKKPKCSLTGNRTQVTGG